VLAARAGSALSHSRLARISSPQTKVRVRAGGGIAFEATAAWMARAASSSVPHPLELSLAPGSWTCATITTRSPGRSRPGISATSNRPGDGWKRVSTATFILTAPALSRAFSRSATCRLALNPNALNVSSYGTDPHWNTSGVSPGLV